MANVKSNPSSDDAVSGFKAIDEIALAAESAAATSTDAAVETTSKAADGLEAMADQTSEFTRSWVDPSERAASAMAGAVNDLAGAPPALSAKRDDLVSGVKELAGEWMQLFRERASKNMDAFDRLWDCRSPQDLLKLQAELAQEAVAETAKAAQRLNEASMRMVAAATLVKPPARP
jgi:hypothetical protein